MPKQYGHMAKIQKFKFTFWHKKHKKTDHKSSILMAVWIFFSAALTAQNSPELKIHIRHVAQDTSVYYSVPYTKWCDQMRNSYKRKYLPIHNTKFTVTLLLCASFKLQNKWKFWYKHRFNKYLKLFQCSIAKIISHFHLLFDAIWHLHNRRNSFGKGLFFPVSIWSLHCMAEYSIPIPNF